MVDTDALELPADSNLNVEGRPNVALCPMCTEVLDSPPDPYYIYKRNNPDTRWFWCTTCKCHLGYHRMRKKWKVDPYDLNSNETVRGYFGLGPVEKTD